MEKSTDWYTGMMPGSKNVTILTMFHGFLPRQIVTVLGGFACHVQSCIHSHAICADMNTDIKHQIFGPWI